MWQKSRPWTVMIVGLMLAGLLVGVAVETVVGQGGPQQLGNSAQIERDYQAILRSFTFMNYVTGREPPTDASVANKAAKYFVYRVTWPILLDAKAEPGKAEPLAIALKEFSDHIVAPGKILANKDKNAAFVKQYAPALVTHFKELTDLPVVDNSRAVLHGAQMLPVLAKLQHESIHDYLLELIDEKSGKHDIIKLWAIRALKEFMPIDVWGDPSDPSLLQDKNKMARKKAELRRVDSLTKFILRPLPSKASAEEIEAYKFLRREAIETLAKAEAPAVAAIGKIGVVEGPIAPILARAILPGGMQPETTTHEKVEAALGLCHMKSIDKYDPQPASFLIGATLIELGREYSEDYGNIALGDKRSLPTTFPWKIIARRFDQGLKQFGKNTPANDKRSNTLEKKGKKVADDMFAYRQLELFDLGKDVGAWKPPASFLMFKPSIKSTPVTWDAIQ